MTDSLSRALHRRLLAPLLPAGLDFDALVPLVEAAPDETVLDDPERLTLRNDRPLQSDYDDLIRLQVALKDSHIGRVLDLVDRHADGDLGAASALATFRKETRVALTQSFKLGVSATADGDATKDPAFAKWLDERTDFEASRFSEFLSRAKEDTEVMPRERRADLYGRTLDHAFNRGGFAAYGSNVRIIWRLSPAEHCSSCIALAAEGPYLPPGVEDEDSDLQPLPTFPRTGDTECLGNCKCYLQVETRKAEDEEPTYAAADRVTETTVNIEDGEEKALDDYTDDELDGFQAEADALEGEMQWARAMYDATGDESYRTRRSKANARSIELQDETGLRFVPRARSDTVSRAMQEGLEQGYEPVLPTDAGKLTPGVEASLVDGTDFVRGTLEEWDPAKGAGMLKSDDGETYAIPDLNAPPYVVGVRGMESFVDRPWKIPDVPKDGFVTQIPAKQASFAEEKRCDEPLEEASDAPCNPIPILGAYRELLDLMPPDHRAGIQLRVTRSERRRNEKAYGSYAPIAVKDLPRYAANKTLLATLLGAAVERRLTARARRDYDLVRAGLAEDEQGPDTFGDAYALWLVDDPALPRGLASYFERLEGEPDLLNDPYYTDEEPTEDDDE